ncbi:SpoIID/LytB domain-containing protein [Clostridium aestuarii]|uniref:SpoIID/LytB domain-containing protein n=1 Tax=Clostridium aestuarii TaxID=338193 RepID=A0ABT4D376_9CLOT|nr:SpoIID/LytB domain-containing protein [Clostridium aestuarii]MCY6485686.1 SpoIID/LytB domain-containing protein [Clostridium aestuarii]
MKKSSVILIIFSITIILTLFFPRKIIHGVLIESTPDYSIMYINGKLKEIKVSNLSFPKYSVICFKYNAFNVFDFKLAESLSNRIIIKENNCYELEKVGSKKLFSKATFYKIDENNNISLGTNRDIIVGKNNVKSFVYNNKLRTFFIYPIDYSTTRVAISTSNFASVYHKNIEIACKCPTKIYSIDENFSLNLPKNSKLMINFEEDTIKLSYNAVSKSFHTRLYIKGDSLTLTNITRGYPVFNPTYSGIVEVYPTKKGMTIINEINLEDYLCKVVPSEMPIWGGLEALKCQSVAARTYAISDMMNSRFANLGFYVDDSTRSQVYNNIPSQEASTKAVKATSGLIMTYNNKPIDAKYYSTSCGMGVNYKNIWFNSDGSSDNKPYLKTNNYLINTKHTPSNEKEWLEFYKNTTLDTYDNNSSYFRWKVYFNKTSLEKNLNINLRNIYKSSAKYITIFKNNNHPKKLKRLPKEFKNLQDIKIINRSAGGNILEISFIFENVIINVKKDTFVRRCFKNSPDINNQISKIILLNEKTLENWSTLPSSFFSIEKVNNTFNIYGGGFGHGVGMSQYGAMYLGRHGENFKNILNTYYKNIDLTKIYQ